MINVRKTSYIQGTLMLTCTTGVRLSCRNIFQLFTNDSKYVLLFSAAKTLLILFMIDNLFKSKSAPVIHYV